jgi:hypothetical protein
VTLILLDSWAEGFPEGRARNFDLEFIGLVGT